MSSTQFFGRACKTCRRRGRGCDRRIPSCATCEANDLVCEGYLLRWSGVASRGRLAGKSIPVNSSSKPCEKRKLPRRYQRSAPSPTVLSATRDDQQTGRDATAPHNNFIPSQQQEPLYWNIDSPTASITQPQAFEDCFLPSNQPETEPDLHTAENPSPDSELIPSSQPPILPGLDILAIPAELKFILEYHLCEVVPKLCVDNFATENPYRDYVFPLATEVPSLLYACAALAACHYNVRVMTNQFQHEFLRFKGKAMKRLQEDLYSEQRAKHPGTLATILMLCLSDICQGGFSTFESHFRGAKNLIDLRGSDRTVGCFVEQYLAWLDIMAAASHSRQPVFSAEDIGGFLNEGGPNWSFDVFPCASEQFQVVCETVSLYKSQSNPEDPLPETLQQVERIKQKLLQAKAQSHRGLHWFHLTEAYRYAIMLYLIRLFPCEIDDFEIDWLVSSVFYHARSTPPASGWSDQLLWPLFHAGLEINDAKRQEWLRKRAQCMQRSGGFGNVQSALNILEGVWVGQRPPRYLDLMLGFGNVNLLLI